MESTEFRVSDDTINPGRMQLISLAGGGFATAWVPDVGEQRQVLIRVFDSFGDPASEVLELSDVNGQNYKIGATGNGGFVAAWFQDADTSLFVAEYNEVGDPVGDITEIESALDDPDDLSAVIRLATVGAEYSIGRVLFTSDSPTEFQLDRLRADSGGVSLVEPFLIAPVGSPGASISSQPDGAFLLIPAGSSNSRDGDEFVQLFNADGTAAAEPARFYSTTENDERLLSSYESAASLSNGAFAVTYTPGRVDKGHLLDADVFAQRISPDGELVGSQISVSSTTIGTQQDSAVIGTPDGGFIVIWTTSPFFLAAQWVAAARFDANGNQVGDEILINSTKLDRSIETLITPVGDNEYFIVWEGAGVLARRFSFDASPQVGTDGPDVLDLSGPDGKLGEGGPGDDLYLVDGPSDQPIEHPDEGVDTIQSWTDWTLADNFENLELVGAATYGAGNELDNTITGNDRDNVLTTGTGGTDLLAGGGGSDTYVIEIKLTGGTTTVVDAPGEENALDLSAVAGVDHLEIPGFLFTDEGESLLIRHTDIEGVNVELVNFFTDGPTIDTFIFADWTVDVRGARTLQDVFLSIRNGVCAEIVDEDNNLWDSTIETCSGEEISSSEAQLFRAYLGAFNRLPDNFGYHWWLTEINEGRHTLRSMMGGFLASDEFRDLLGVEDGTRIDNGEFLDHIYRNVFGREPDDTGRAYWLNELQTGSKSQAQVLEEMTQSNEFVELTLASAVHYLVG